MATPQVHQSSSHQLGRERDPFSYVGVLWLFPRPHPSCSLIGHKSEVGVVNTEYGNVTESLRKQLAEATRRYNRLYHAINGWKRHTNGYKSTDVG